ncbi:hypothetical protein PQX77_013742 [Marasmius sp. AFHP31]|nr:hypothetical protein PQX77_013742 [Marasmius sp. AFHP31]
MAQQRTFEIRIADGIVVTLTTCVPGTLEVIFSARDGDGDGPFLKPVEAQKDYYIPITIDNSYQPKDVDYNPQPTPARHHPHPVQQPTHAQLKASLAENNITPLDHAYNPNTSLTQPVVPSTFDPYTALIDYEDCLRTYSKPDIFRFPPPDAEAIEEPMVWGDRIADLTVDEIVSLLPDQTPTPKGRGWGYTPYASVFYPLLVLQIQGHGRATSRDVYELMGERPYSYCPDPPRRQREYAVPGVILDRLLAIGWITDEEAKERWLDIDWFSLRDYRAKKGKGKEEFYVVKRERRGKIVFDGRMETREAIWRQQRESVEARRLQLEMEILMREGRTEDEAAGWYERRGFAYMTAPDGDGDAVDDEDDATEDVDPSVPYPSKSSPFSPELVRGQPDLSLLLSAVAGTSNGNVDKMEEEDSSESDTDVDMDLPSSPSPRSSIPTSPLPTLPIAGSKRKACDSDSDSDSEPSTSKRKKPSSASSTPKTPPRRSRAPLPRIPPVPATPLLRTIPLPTVEDEDDNGTPPTPHEPGVRTIRSIEENLRRDGIASPTSTTRSVSVLIPAPIPAPAPTLRRSTRAHKVKTEVLGTSRTVTTNKKTKKARGGRASV